MYFVLGNLCLLWLLASIIGVYSHARAHTWHSCQRWSKYYTKTVFSTWAFLMAVMWLQFFWALLPCGNYHGTRQSLGPPRSLAICFHYNCCWHLSNIKWTFHHCNESCFPSSLDRDLSFVTSHRKLFWSYFYFIALNEMVELIHF